MKTKWNIIGVILVAIGVAAYWYYTREASLLDAPGGVCPRCQSNDVGKWVYGLVDENSEDSTFVAEIRKGKVHLGGCAITMDSPMCHCNAYGFNWGNFHEMFNNKK